LMYLIYVGRMLTALKLRGTRVRYCMLTNIFI
jgi:hypothetical protein